jgi:hypothetical protein
MHQTTKHHTHRGIAAGTAGVTAAAASGGCRWLRGRIIVHRQVQVHQRRIPTEPLHGCRQASAGSGYPLSSSKIKASMSNQRAGGQDCMVACNVSSN